VADRCAATGEGKADEIDRVLRRVPAYLLKNIAGDDDATTFEALRASSGGAIVCVRPQPLRNDMAVFPRLPFLVRHSDPVFACKTFGAPSVLLWRFPCCVAVLRS
jgi:hypothetical protein